MSDSWSETRDANTCLVGSGPARSGSVRVRVVEFGLCCANACVLCVLPYNAVLHSGLLLLWWFFHNIIWKKSTYNDTNKFFYINVVEIIAGTTKQQTALTVTAERFWEKYWRGAGPSSFVRQQRAELLCPIVQNWATYVQLMYRNYPENLGALARLGGGCALLALT